jgi:hypothetical protein
MNEKKIESAQVDKKKIEISQAVGNIVDQWVNDEMGNRLTRNNAWALRMLLNQYFNQLQIEETDK